MCKPTSMVRCPRCKYYSNSFSTVYDEDKDRFLSVFRCPMCNLGYIDRIYPIVGDHDSKSPVHDTISEISDVSMIDPTWLTPDSRKELSKRRWLNDVE